MSQVKYRKLLSPILILLIWQFIAVYGIVPAWFLPVPTEVMKTLAAMVASGEIPHHTLVSLGRAVSGYLLAAVIGISLGLLIAWSTIVEDFFDPLIELIRPLSTFALIPIFFSGSGSAIHPRS